MNKDELQKKEAKLKELLSALIKQFNEDTGIDVVEIGFYYKSEHHETDAGTFKGEEKLDIEIHYSL